MFTWLPKDVRTTASALKAHQSVEPMDSLIVVVAILILTALLTYQSVILMQTCVTSQNALRTPTAHLMKFVMYKTSLNT